MARRTGKTSEGAQQSLDSLVDIVSNMVGILVILAAFMALFGLINPSDLETTRRTPPQVEPPKKILVPWSHPTNKNPVLFAVRGNRIYHMDMRVFFQNLAKQPKSDRPRAVTLEQTGMKVRFFPVTDQIYCLEFRPQSKAGETWLQASEPGSDWLRVAALYSPEKFYYFFWVAGDSFELFRDLRAALWKKQYEVGWKPAQEEKPLEICNGFEGSSGFQPQ